MTRTTRRNEGGRYSTKTQSDWYKAIEAANLAKVEAEQTAADDAERALTTALAHQVGAAVTAMPEAASRIAKAAALVQAKDVWPLTSGSYLVGSQGTQDAYLVQRHPLRCECADATHRQHLCKHALAVALTVKLGSTYEPSYN